MVVTLAGGVGDNIMNAGELLPRVRNPILMRRTGLPHWLRMCPKGRTVYSKCQATQTQSTHKQKFTLATHVPEGS
jgi:hypothetical protein